MMRPTTVNRVRPYRPSVPSWIADADGGMSETTPTRSRSTSCLTRIERQKGHVVCTALDQRKVISAPQLGQFAVKCRAVSGEWRLHQQPAWNRGPHSVDRGA